MVEAVLYKCPMCPHAVKTKRGLAHHVQNQHTTAALVVAAPVASTVVEFITPESIELDRMQDQYQQLCADVIANRVTLERVRPAQPQKETATPAALAAGILQCRNVLDKTVANVLVAENKLKTAVDACKVASELLSKAQHDACVDRANDQLDAHAIAMRIAWKQATEKVRTAQDDHSKLLHVRDLASEELARAQKARDNHTDTQERQSKYAQAREAHTKLIRTRNAALVVYKRTREGLRAAHEARRQYMRTQDERHYDVEDAAEEDDGVY
jgi:hypothetical protein